MSFRVKVAAAVAVVALAVSASAMALGSGWAPPVLRLVPTPETTPTARGPGVPPSAPASTSSNTPASQSGETLFTQPNPQAQTGYLPNGVRWGVMERRGTRQVTVMFYVGAGSVNETGAEAGIAHFLEHMSVNGSTNFPADTMIPLMARLGIAFGRDQNASTGFTGTTFRLDMTEVTPQKLDLAMKWMRDIADGLTLAQTDVDKERGVILSEYNESRDPQRDVQLKIMQFLGPTLRVAQRDPIGTRESISRFSAGDLRAYYERWYRPQGSAVIIVGDGSNAEFRQRIEQTFSNWRNPRPAPPPVDLGRLDPRRPTSVLAITEPRAPQLVQVCRGRDRDPPQREGVVTRVRDFSNFLWMGALQDRLAHLSRSANPPFTSAGPDQMDDLESASFTCVTLATRNGDWKAAVRAAAVETRRMETHLLTDQEFESQTSQLSAALDDGVNSTDTMTPPTLADAILFNFTHQGTFSSAREDRRIGGMALDRITREDVRNEFRRIWTNAGQPLIVVISPTAVDQAEIRREWDAAQSGPAPDAPKDVVTAPWAYSSFGPAGRPVTREVMANPSFVRVEFANGVRVNFKQTQNAADRVEVRIRFGAGYQELTPADASVARIAQQFFGQMALGKNSAEDIVRVCESRLCDAQLIVNRESFVLKSTTRAADLDLDLQLLSAYLTDPGFRPDIDAHIPTEAENLYRAINADPQYVANFARERAMAPPLTGVFPTLEQMRSMRVADFRRVLYPVLTRDALEVTVIGDVSEARALQAIANTLGALPPRQRVDRARAGAPVIRFPQPMPPIIRLTHDGAADKALVSLSWRLFAWKPELQRDAKVVDLLTLMLSDQLTEDIRERLGSSYSPRAVSVLQRGGDDGAIYVDLQTSPAQAELVRSEIRKIVAKIAAGSMTQDDLDRARLPLLNYGATRTMGNDWWIETMDGSWAHPDQLVTANRWGDYQTITLDDIKAMARKWLVAEPLTIIVTPKSLSSDGARPRRPPQARR
ncbi:MAG: insulinase family protein [Caulobacteraceae bacterium]